MKVSQQTPRHRGGMILLAIVAAAAGAAAAAWRQRSRLRDDPWHPATTGPDDAATYASSGTFGATAAEAPAVGEDAETSALDDALPGDVAESTAPAGGAGDGITGDSPAAAGQERDQR